MLLLRVDIYVCMGKMNEKIDFLYIVRAALKSYMTSERIKGSGLE
jgi:hypothetical protein